MPQNAFPIQHQVRSLVANCLQLTRVDCFYLAFEKECATGIATNNSCSPNIPTAVKTPLSWINDAFISMFGGNCVSLEQCSTVAKNVFGLNAHDVIGNTYLELMLIGCILERREPDSSVANVVSDATPPMKAYDVQCIEHGDFWYCTCIAFLP